MLDNTVYSESCKHGSEGGLCRPTLEIRQGGTFLPYNFIASMVYTQMFNTLCDKALENGGALKTHVTCLLDEFANQLKFNSTYILFYIQLSGWYSGEKGWRNDYKNGYGRAAI